VISPHNTTIDMQLLKSEPPDMNYCCSSSYRSVRTTTVYGLAAGRTRLMSFNNCLDQSIEHASHNAAGNCQMRLRYNTREAIVAAAYQSMPATAPAAYNGTKPRSRAARRLASENVALNLFISSHLWLVSRSLSRIILKLVY